MKALVWCVMVTVAGCGAPAAMYSYRVVNDGCNCEMYHLTDAKARVSYSFSGLYSVQRAIRTQLTLSIRNDNRDTLDLSLAYVRVTSRNIPYHYNGKSLPVTVGDVPPGKERTLTLEGEADAAGADDPWRAIAGEELVVTIEGMRMNGRPLATQVIRCVPQNPKL